MSLPAGERPIDLRSDTVTRPTPAMREAIARADVGDDVYGEDPQVNRLEARVAERLGKEAAVFVPSGTMANQLALRAWTRHGDVVLAGEDAHVLRFEGGAAAALAGVQIRTLGRGGLFGGDAVRAGLDSDDPHLAPERLVCVENTHNHAGGAVFPLDALRDVADAARGRGLPLHMDGARLWNAVVATAVPAAEWAAPCDSVSVCLSKGLGAPVGSLVSGDRDFVRRVRRLRKMYGGGMRQAGVLAAAGLHALDHHVERLAEDHANARRLAGGLEALGLAVAPRPETNIVMFRAPDVLAFLRATRARGVLLNPADPQRLRAVTHLDVSEADVDEALRRIGEARKDWET